MLSPLFVALEVVLECLLPLVMASMIDNMTGNSMAPIFKYGIALACMAMLSLLCGALAGKYAATASCGFAKNLRQDLFFKIQDFSFADIDTFSTSSLVTRMTTDVTNVQNAYQMIIRVAVRTPLMLIFSVIMGMSISVRISLIFLAMIPIIGGALLGIAWHVFPIFKRIFKKYDRMNESVQENIAGIRVVKSFVREDYAREKFYAQSESVRRDFTHVEKILALNEPIMMFGIYVCMLLVSLVGANIIISSHGSALTTGELSSLINYGVQILASMMMFSMVFVMCMMAAEPVQRITEVLKHESVLENPENGKKTLRDGSISFDHVSFRYSDKSKKYALSDITFDIPSGATIGIIGGTGSGKTKELIDQVNAAVKEEKGSVVCISRGDKLTFDISHDARLIDAKEYPIKGYEGLLGFVGGIHAGNYDITRVFIDGLYKITGEKDAAKAETFLDELSAFSEKHTVNFVVSLSEDPAAATEGMKKYL